MLSPMQENEAHDLSVVVPLDLTAPVATFVLGDLMSSLHSSSEESRITLVFTTTTLGPLLTWSKISVDCPRSGKDESLNDE